MKSTHRLSRSLRLAALLALVGALVTWVATGAHVGWTQTTITTLQYDEITGINYPVHRAGFVAGVEVLALGAAAAVSFAAAAFLAQRRAVRA